jgi:hypothetical protein
VEELVGVGCLGAGGVLRGGGVAGSDCWALGG